MCFFRNYFKLDRDTVQNANQAFYRIQKYYLIVLEASAYGRVRKMLDVHNIIHVSENIHRFCLIYITSIFYFYLVSKGKSSL